MRLGHKCTDLEAMMHQVAGIGLIHFRFSFSCFVETPPDHDVYTAAIFLAELQNVARSLFMVYWNVAHQANVSRQPDFSILGQTASFTFLGIEAGI